MPAGTPHPGLLIQLHACFVISPKGVFTTDEPDVLPVEVQKDPALLKQASILSRSLSDGQIEELIHHSVHYVYCEMLSEAQKKTLEEAGVQLLH